MTALIRFELQKVWRKGSFLCLMVLLLLLNVFLLWYSNQPTGDESPLSAYKAVCQDISGMTEHEKLNFIRELKEQADGLSLVEQVQSLYGQGSEAGESLAEQLKESNSDIYEKYEELYRTGGYLVYTDSLAKERTLLDELYEEISTVSGMMIIWLLYKKAAVNLVEYPFFNRLHPKKILEVAILQKVPQTMQGYPQKISTGSHRKG